MAEYVPKYPWDTYPSPTQKALVDVVVAGVENASDDVLLRALIRGASSIGHLIGAPSPMVDDLKGKLEQVRVELSRRLGRNVSQALAT